MSSYINVDFDLTGETLVIPLNRWSRCCYSLQFEGAGTVILNGTLVQINRRNTLTGVPNTPIWDVLDDDSGTPISAVGADIYRVDGYSLEAVQIVATGAVNGNFMQQGDVG